MSNDFDMDAFLNKEFECTRSGDNLYFDCPFCKEKNGRNYWFNTEKTYIHEKNNQEYKGLGQCWKCDKSHSVLTFIMEYKKLDLFEALNFIEGDSELSLKDLKNKLHNMDKFIKDDIFDMMNDFLPTISAKFPEGCSEEYPKKLIDWFVNERVYPKESLKWLKVKYCWKSHTDPSAKIKGTNLPYIVLRNRAIFPITCNGVKAWQAYLFQKGINQKTGKPFPKTRNPPGPIMHSILFFYDKVKNDKTIIVHEGIFDTLRTFSRGYSPVGLLGSHLSVTQAYLLSQTNSEEICIGLDGGKREEIKAFRAAKLLEEFCDKEITILKLPHGIDPDDVSNKVFNHSFKNRYSLKRFTNTLTHRQVVKLINQKLLESTEFNLVDTH